MAVVSGLINISRGLDTPSNKHRSVKRISKFYNRTLRAVAVSSAFVSIVPLVGHADTRTAKVTGTTLEAAWTNCPAYPSVATDCNYTGMYSGKSGTDSAAMILQLATLRVFPDGSVQIIASAAGTDQPANSYTAPTSTLSSGSVSGSVFLYGDCGDPSNINTCYYYGTASLSATLKQIGGTWSWSEYNTITDPTSLKYKVSNLGSSRPAKPTGSAKYEGQTWTLGTYVSGRLATFTNTQTLTCPTTCPSTTSSARTAGAPLANVPSLDTPTLKVPAPQVPAAVGSPAINDSNAASIAAGVADLRNPSARISNK